MSDPPDHTRQPPVAGGPFRRIMAAPFLGAIRLYQLTLSPFIGGHCRFQPTCSRYAEAVYRTHNPLSATALTLRRLLRCHPLGGKGWDPPPPRRAGRPDETSAD